MRFGILGPLAVWTADGRPVRVPEHKVRALLAGLLVHAGHTVSVDRLAHYLWGENPPSNVTGALHTKVWQLRRALEDGEPGASDLIVSHPPGYVLRVDHGLIDSHRFQSLTAEARKTDNLRAKAALLADALALWRGPALAEFYDEEFAQPAAARLEEHHLLAVEDRAEVLLELGEHSLLVGELGDLVAQHPLRERLRAAQMRALYRAGRQTEALRGFDELYNLLADRFGLEPGAELIELRQAILEQDPAIDARPTPATTTARRLNNLPAALGELVGREGAVVEVRAALDVHRLVTLNGVGGVGKTSLALAVAREMTEHYPDGVWLVELAGVERPADSDSVAWYADMVARVAAALGVRDELVAADLAGDSQVPLARRLADALGARQMLLVLDNCEHVIEPVARLAEMLLKAVPGLKVLATSQEPFGIAGERLWTVPPLSLPEAKDDLDEARRSSAVRLFVTRAAAAAPGFVLEPAHLADVLAICRRLDGIPFALELAATRVRALGVREVANRLEDRFTLLTVGKRGAPSRQQTLRAAIDWSWQLLTDPERAVLRRLSVHSGGFTLRSAEEVCAGGDVAADQVMDLLARLVDRSLVTHDGADGRRYRLLESVGAYCVERIHEAGEADEVRLRHLRHYLRLAEQARANLYGPDQPRWLDRLDDESANLRAALDHAVQRGAADLGLRLVNALAWYWFLRGRLGEGGRALSAALGVARDASETELAKAMAWRAGFAMRAGDPVDSLEKCDARLREADDDPLGRATALWFLGFAQVGFGDPHSSEVRIKPALDMFTALGDQWGVAAVLSTQATLAVLRGDLATIRDCGERSAAMFRELGDGWGQLQAMDVLAHLAEIRGDHDYAGRLHRNGLRIAEKLGLWLDVSIKLSGLARIALLSGDFVQARELHERARRLAAQQGFTFGEQFAEVGLGMGARRQGDLDTAEMHFNRWLDWCRQSTSGGNGAALILAELGFIAEGRGDAEAAMRLHTEGFAAARATQDPRTVALSLEGLAGAQVLAGRPDVAALLLGAAAEARETAGTPLPEQERGDVDRITAAARAASGAESFARHVEEGRRLSPDEVLCRCFPNPPDHAHGADLCDRGSPEVVLAT